MHQQSVATAAHCINPACPRPYPQSIGNNFCNICGATLRLKNRYIPLERLGFGGFAAIYSVWDIKTQTERVLKVLLETSPKALSLFEQEAMVLASLRHPGVPKVEPDSYFQVIVGDRQGQLLPCLVMEKIVGQTLADILKHHPQGCPEKWVVNWLNQAVQILRELHLRKIIHRDIKPSNLMLRHGTGQLVLIDFGGAKQIGPAHANSQASSTRLFSPGYSPPEQIAGGVVGPSADFYALGLTCIQLLTGQYPPDMEDPKTGELRWRQYAKVSPGFAALLDDMVRSDVDRRPSNAREMIKRLRKISPGQITPNLAVGDLWKIIPKTLQICLNLLLAALALTWKWTKWLCVTAYHLTIQLIKACFGTLLQMVSGGIGAGVGAGIGFWLADRSPHNFHIPGAIAQQLPSWVSNIAIAASKPQMILFAAAGLGTAWGLTQAKSLGQQQRRYLIAGIMGVFGYAVGWLILQRVAPSGVIAPDDLVIMTAVAAFLLTLGLGLPSHDLVHAVFTAIGTASIFAGLVTLTVKILPVSALFGFSDAFFHTLNWTNFGFSIIFFSLLGIILGFWLGVSYYIFVPFLRFLGFR
ncbi:serine/threonine protein kinase [Aerosakkonema funiforme]|uniref:serine/threonine protein kinase n=1 Tax=Aerosakkonema funiforme TaxID=1246630 RepID=UPI0035BB8D37